MSIKICDDPPEYIFGQPDEGKVKKNSGVMKADFCPNLNED
jgi:hypothetical protein